MMARPTPITLVVAAPRAGARGKAGRPGDTAADHVEKQRWGRVRTSVMATYMSFVREGQRSLNEKDGMAACLPRFVK